MLNKGGFVRSIRGAQGGYQLCCDPRSTTVGSILRALEGSMCPVECVDGEEIRCERAAGCVTVGVWRKLCRAIEDVIDSITLADLVDEYNEKGALNYSI